MCVDSWAAFYSFQEGREQWIGEKEGRPDLDRTALPGLGALEVEPQTELHAARIVGRIQVQKGGGAGCKSWTNAAVLGVVEDVECLPSEFETGLLANGVILEKAEVEIDMIWQFKGVASESAEGESSGSREGCWVEA